MTYSEDNSTGPIYVRGECYFRPKELSTVFPIMHQFYGPNELIVCEKINEYMGYELVKIGESIAYRGGEKIEKILDEAERRGELYVSNNVSVFTGETDGQSSQ